MKITPSGNSTSIATLSACIKVPSYGISNISRPGDIKVSPSGISNISRPGDIKVIGIDPGVTATGFAIIQGQKGVCTGTIRPKKADSYHKLEEICAALEQVMREHRPDLAALEKAFYHKNVASLVRISELRGAIIHTLIQTGTEIVEYMPTHIKLTATGNGRASKLQVRYFVEQLFRTGHNRISHHAIDALAIAYTASRRARPRIDRADD